MEDDGLLEVRCAGCGDTLEVERSLTEFACPGCATPQALPPELMPPPRPRRALPLGPARVPCGGCGAVLAVPRGVPGRLLACPLCGAEIDIGGGRRLAAHSGVHVISPTGAVALAATSSRLPEEGSISRAIRTGQAQLGRYNVPTPFPARSVREESICSPRSNTRTAVHVDWARSAPVSHSIHTEESPIRLLNETVDRHDFRKRSRPSAGPGSVCVDRVRLEHPCMVNHALRTQEGPSNHSMHAEEAQGENQSSAIIRIGTQKARHAISNIVEQETVEPPSQTAFADQVEVESCDNTAKLNQKRKRSSKTAAWDQKGKNGDLSSSSEQFHRTCSKLTQPECTRNRNPIQESASSPNENRFDPADIDRIITRLCPSESPQKRVLQESSNDLDKTLPTVSIDHDISQDDCFPHGYRQYRAVATGPPVQQPPPHYQLSVTPNSQMLGILYNLHVHDILTCRISSTWDVDPPCPKVSSTISALLKQWHPGSTYVPANQVTNEVHQEELILHWHQYHSNARATIMDEFLVRFISQQHISKFIRQFTSFLCDEKRRARVELAASRKAKETLDAARSKQTNLDDEDAGEELKQQRRDPAAVGSKDDDPLQWKPFPPEWMKPKWWEMLCEHWASEEVLQVSAQKRKNRYTGGSAQHTAGSRSIAMHRKLMPVSDIEVFNRTHKRDGGKGEFVTEKAKETVERIKRRLEVAGDTELDPHLVWAQEVGGRSRGRYYGLHGIIDKARIKAMLKSTPGHVDKVTKKEMFTQDQVQEMIRQATEQLNEAWEKRFQSLEQRMHDMVSLEDPQYNPGPLSAEPVAGDQPVDEDRALHQVNGKLVTYSSALVGTVDFLD
ncbi:hypothetical protein BAE44_0025940 [Dichanthelium oligosanthes]|uniref:Uncharacterized protein n=1 Tax=Dichanthelium oligosanthes TaxID=888268 RepID=A0A1E5UJJ8_9POAL|nr:hypothetical protein BAE44_0025940 [Dichanthelium oligosanthes]